MNLLSEREKPITETDKIKIYGTISLSGLVREPAVLRSYLICPSTTGSYITLRMRELQDPSGRVLEGRPWQRNNHFKEGHHGELYSIMLI